MNHPGVGVVFRDVLLGVIGILVLAFFVVLMQVRPPTAVEASATPPGNMSFTIVWPTGDQDVDAWILAPGDDRAVGYSNKSGKVVNLLRDDLGNILDETDLNFETAYSRGMPEGEWVLNVHCYKCNTFPTPVRFEIGSTSGGLFRVLLSGTVNLTYNGQEVTAARFRIDKYGNVIAGSVSHVFRPLRAGT